MKTSFFQFKDLLEVVSWLSVEMFTLPSTKVEFSSEFSLLNGMLLLR